MSLKQYNPHLQLTIRSSHLTPACLAWLLTLVTALFCLKAGWSLWFLSCAVALGLLGYAVSWHLASKSPETLCIQGRQMQYGEYSGDIERVRLLFAYWVLIECDSARDSLWLARDQLSTRDWRALVSYSKLFSRMQPHPS